MSDRSGERRRRTLLAEFDRKRRRWRRVLAERFDAEETDAVLPEVRANFAATVDEIPYANRPEPVMADQIVAAYQYLALYKTLKARGKSLQEIGALADELIESPVPRWVPRWLLPLTSRLFFVPRMRRYARESQESADPDEFVYEFVEGDGGDLDFGLNVRSCAICKMATKHDAIEMVPYLCATDDKVFAAIGLGLRRTGTIALGATSATSSEASRSRSASSIRYPPANASTPSPAGSLPGSVGVAEGGFTVLRLANSRRSDQAQAAARLGLANASRKLSPSP